MFSLITGFASFIIPGLGQIMHGEFMAGIIWFAVAAVIGPIVNIFAAIHAMTLGGKSKGRCGC
jgi:TM2 domain-containing membrane protein YozV|tara:strand:- start:281 stop:469 length:189 start_codon:yes stop_codon:yes gene_type:complete